MHKDRDVTNSRRNKKQHFQQIRIQYTAQVRLVGMVKRDDPPASITTRSHARVIHHKNFLGFTRTFIPGDGLPSSGHSLIHEMHSGSC